MLSVKNIKKEYISGSLRQKALDDVSLDLRDNEFVAILGPSGSGKTTLLNIIGGLDSYDSGDLIIDGVSTKEYNDRKWDTYRNHKVGFIFQSYNLIGHQTVLANVELALTISGINGAEKEKRALEALELVGLKEHAYKKPNQLSGGQMQRVAIARALVNDPTIVLADEPTGALDGKTGVQVMELLKKIAKDRLVVMVTHNPELANEYATRIVDVKDGKIVGDSNPFVADEKLIEEPKVNYSSMSFKTAIKLSFNNLKSKKARTILTAFAGSIGIIGIALILSISSGVNEYIQSVESSTMSEYPLEITKSGINMQMEEIGSNKEDSEVKIANMISMMFSTVQANDIKSLSDYLSTNEDIINNTKAIEYDYNYEPSIYTLNNGKVRQVHPDKSFNSLGMGSNLTSNSMISTMMSTDVFYSLPKEDSLYIDNYEVLEGKWPSNANEAVVVLSKNHAMPDLLLYHLGLKPYEELDDAIKNFSENDGTKISQYDKAIHYKDLIGINYKVINPSELYIKDQNYDLYVDKSKNNQYLKDLYQKSEDLKIVGVVSLKPEADFAMLRSGIAYHNDLVIREITKANESELVKKQIDNPKIDILTGNEFNDVKRSLDLSELFTIDEDKIQRAFGIDTSKVNLSLNLKDFKIDLSKLVLPDLNSLIKELNLSFEKEELVKMEEVIQKDLSDYLINNPSSTIDDYLSSDRFSEVLSNEIGLLLKNKGMDEEWFNKLEGLVKITLNQNIDELAKQFNDNFNDQIKNSLSTINQAFYFDADLFTSAIGFKMNSEELGEVLMTSSGNEIHSYDDNLKKFGYRDLNSPENISIYPNDFESKKVVTDTIDHYNQLMEKVDKTKVISYIDYVKTLMNSVTSIVDVVSWVLIAFVAISLIVSSIMIGVITYISVLERKKEIGILRAIGASKKNIANVFNAEVMMIGLLSGIIGIAMTLIILIPINNIIKDIAGDIVVRAYLPIGGAISLIIISVILTYIGGLIPSSKASKENPVLALRSE